MRHARGDTVVHPRHGTAVVTRVLQRDIGSGPTEYLELFVEQTSLTVMIPVAAVGQVGIRDVCSKEHAEEILALLSSDAEVHERWADRNAVTADRMKSGGLSGLAMVIRDLTRHAEHSGKPLSGAERGARETCISALARELSVALQLSKDEMTTLILERSTT